ncbi:MAG: hypothetical protein R2759_16275 [Bacteroidales bacterium]
MDEERHFDQYDVELDNIGRFGDSYLLPCNPSNVAKTARLEIR